VFIAFSLAGRAGILKDSAFVQLLLFWSLFIFLALHIKEQFAHSQAFLTPGYRRVHAMVASIAALIVVVVLPTVLSWFLDLHFIGFVAVMVLLFGTILWCVVKDSTWTHFAMFAGSIALFGTKLGQDRFREIISGQFETLAVAIFGLGILITVLAGIRLVRLNEEMPGYYNKIQRSRQAWSDKGQILPRLED
jgi:hypothetical protein